MVPGDNPNEDDDMIAQNAESDKSGDELLHAVQNRDYSTVFAHACRDPEHVLEKLDQLFDIAPDLGAGLTPHFNPHITDGSLVLDAEDIRIRLEIKAVLPRATRTFNKKVENILQDVDKKIENANKRLQSKENTMPPSSFRP